MRARNVDHHNIDKRPWHWIHFTKEKYGKREEWRCNYCHQIFSRRPYMSTRLMRAHIILGRCPNHNVFLQSPSKSGSDIDGSDQELQNGSYKQAAMPVLSSDDEKLASPSEDTKPTDIHHSSLSKPLLGELSDSISIKLHARDEVVQSMKKFLVINLTENDLELTVMERMVNEVLRTLELLTDDDANFNETVRDLISMYRRISIEVHREGMKVKLERHDKLLDEKNEMVKEVATVGNHLGNLKNKVHELEKELSKLEGEVCSLQTKLEEPDSNLTKFGEELIAMNVKVETVHADEARAAFERTKSRLRSLVDLKSSNGGI